MLRALPAFLPGESRTTRWLLATSTAIAVLAASATGAFADVPPPGGGPIPPRSVTITGTVAELTEGHITLDAVQTSGGRRTFLFAGPVHTDALGLRLGDTAAVLLVGRGNPFAAPVAAIDRILPVSDLSLRVYEANGTPQPAALGRGPGCWLAGSIEICFVSDADAVALRYADGKLACSARLAPARDRERWAVAAAPSCSGGARWALASMRCDATAQSCTIAVADRASEERLAMTRR